MTKQEKQDYIKLCIEIEVKEAYCKNCSKCDVCYQEGKNGCYKANEKECKEGLYYADKQQLKKDLRRAYNYIPTNFYL